MIKLGLLSAILPDLDFYQLVDYCKNTGFEAIEVACWPMGSCSRRYGGVTHLDIKGGCQKDLEEKLNYAEKQNIKISALAYYPNPLSADQEERNTAVQHIKDLIRAAAENQVGQVNTFIGKDKNKTIEENMILFEKTWAPMIDYAEEKKVRIAIENCPMYFSIDEWPGGNNLAHSPAIWRKMFQIIDSKYFGLNYDPSHQVIQDMDYIKPIYEFRDKIFHVHFKDVHIKREQLNECGRMTYPLEYMDPKLPGLGDIDWAAFCGALYGIHYQGYACIEVEDRNFEDSLESIKSGIELAYRYMRLYV